MRTYAFNHYSERIVVDVTGQVLRAELCDEAGFLEWRRVRSAEQAAAQRGDDADDSIRILKYDMGASWRSPVYPSAVAASDSELMTFTPLLALATKAKAFDDRLLACVEIIAHDGAGPWRGLYDWLSELRGAQSADSDARGLLDAATYLASDFVDEERPDDPRAQSWLSAFESEPFRSQPLGIYAEDSRLAGMFRHDSLLQSKLPSEVARSLRASLCDQPGLRAAYESHLALVAGLTGPLVDASVLVEDATSWALLPASDSAEGRVFKELYENRPIPEGFSITDELIARIRDGRLPTVPGADDGFYAHQFHATAALLEPATRGLEVGPRYREELEQTFKALFALNRETHVKQLEGLHGGGNPLIIAPRISVEPIPGYYERQAAAYGFLRRHLLDTLGEVTMHGTSIARRSNVSLHDALVAMEMLFRGAGVVARRELGQVCEEPEDAAAAVAAFRGWQRTSPEDPDLAADMRVAVPVYRDLERKTIRICATLGVETRTLRFEFIEKPTVERRGQSKANWPQNDPIFTYADVPILSPITIECDVEVPPTREELREICDRYKTPEAIRAALEARNDT